MEEIRVGEFVRTKRGSIGKFKFYGIDDEDEKIVYFKNNKGTNCVDENEVTKHSSNLIDLIEVGDYVNGYFCNNIIDIDTGEKYLCNFDLNEMRWIPLKDIDIWESIVTREQFESVMYEV